MARTKTVSVDRSGITAVYVKFSSTISRLAWVEDNLIVEFVSGQKYKYFEVPIEILHKLITSYSVGSEFDKLVKKGNFRFEKLND